MTGPMLVLAAEAMVFERRQEIAAHARRRRLIDGGGRAARPAARRARGVPGTAATRA